MQRAFGDTCHCVSPPCRHRWPGRAGIGFLLATLLLLALSHTAPAASYTWVGSNASAVQSDAWDDVQYWQPQGVPGPGDDVNLGNDAVVYDPGTSLGNVTVGTNTIFFAQNSVSVANLTVGTKSSISSLHGLLTVQGMLTTSDLLPVYNLVLGPGSQVAGTRTLRAGTGSTQSTTTLEVDGSDSIDTLNLFGARVTGTGRLTLTGTASTWGAATVSTSVTIAPDGDLYVGGANIAGDLTVSIGASLHGGTKFHEGYQVDGTITNSGTFDSRNNANVAGKGAIINKGLFLAGATGFSPNFVNAYPSSQVQVTGAVAFDGAFDNHGHITVPAVAGPLATTPDNYLTFHGPVTYTGDINVAGPGSSANAPMPTVEFDTVTSVNDLSTFRGDGLYVLSGMAHLLLPHVLSVRNLQITGGSPAGAVDGGNLIIANKATWSGGIIGTSRVYTLTIGHDASLDIVGGSSPGGLILKGRALENFGIIHWHDGAVKLDAGAKIINEGTIQVANGSRPGAAAIQEVGANVTGLSNDFQSLIQVPTGSYLECDVPFSNGGTVSIVNGRMTLGAGGETTDRGNFRILGQHGLLEFTKGTYNLNASPDNITTFTGNGLCRVNGGTLSVQYKAQARVQHCELAAGTLTGSGNFDVDGEAAQMVWSGGTMSGAGKTTIAPGALLLIQGQDDKTLTRRDLNNNGTAVWTGRGNLMVNGEGQINNTGLLKLESAHTLGGGRQAISILVNSSRLVRTNDLASGNGRGTTTLDGAVTNSGEVLVESQTLALTHGYTQFAGTTGLYETKLLVSGGPMTIAKGSNLFGGGDITGNVINSGSVTPGYGSVTKTTALRILGNYTQTATGVLDISMAKGPFIDFNQVGVSGNATLAGTLNVLFLNLFDPRPSVGSSFRGVIGYRSHSGSFAALSGERQFFTIQYQNTGVLLVATAGEGNAKDRATTGLSTAHASTVDGTPLLQLTFTRPLAADTASDAASYQVTLTRSGSTRPLAIDSASYNATTRTVTLALTVGSMRHGDTVTVRWPGLRDSSGQAVVGQTPPLQTR